MRDGSAHAPADGTFWQIDTPDQRVPGQLSVTGAPALETLGRLFDERSHRVNVTEHGGTTVAMSGDADDLIADWAPRDIHGTLADGRRVSVVGAQGGKTSSHDPSFPPQYRQRFATIRHVILDEHVDHRQTYACCKFRLTGPNWLRHEDGSTDTADGGRLVARTIDDDHWFEYTPAQPQTILEFDRKVLHPIETLARLVTGGEAQAVDLSIQVAQTSPWRPVHRVERPAEKNLNELLDGSYITPHRCALWMEFRRQTNGLDAAALDDLHGVAIQTEVLTRAAVAEGLHRRLYPSQKPHRRAVTR